MGAISTCEASSQAPDGVLIVEDEPLVALFLKDVVEESGWRVDAIAPSCKEALDQAEKHNIQLAFVDVRL
jgi:DNA-binding response OmpR family regulator